MIASSATIGIVVIAVDLSLLLWKVAISVCPQ
jgi:hypothetical protein